MSRTSRVLLAIALLAALAGCGGFGKVTQGRVIAFDPGKRLVTFIEDSHPANPAQQMYDVLPPITMSLPENPNSMGQAPVAGSLLRLDAAKGELLVFDASTGALKTISCSIVSLAGNVFRNDPRVRRVSFPVVDREKKTITTYLEKERQLVTFSVAGEYLTLPPDVWKAGDEIRCYYKERGKALRLMNVTRTETT